MKGGYDDLSFYSVNSSNLEVVLWVITRENCRNKYDI